jgi:hypothetical protein
MHMQQHIAAADVEVGRRDEKLLMRVRLARDDGKSKQLIMVPP